MLTVPVWTCVASLLVVIGPSRQQSCDRLISNNVVDFVLAQLVSTVYHSVELAPINQTFFHGHGWLILGNGTALGLDTVRRVGDLEIDMSDDFLHATLTISFSNFTIAFEHLNIKLFLFKTAGSFLMSVIENEVEISVTMQRKSLCFIEVNRIKFLKLSDFRVGLKTTKCKRCSKTVNWMAKLALDTLDDVVRRTVQENVDEFIRNVLKHNEESMVCQSIQV